MKANQLLLVLGYNAGDAPRAEKLLDFIYDLSGRKKHDGCVLLVAAPNVHAELRTKVELAAQVAFEGFETTVAAGEIGDKVSGSNRLFKHAANHVAMNYRNHWLWIEPDCVPLKKGWLAEIQTAYFDQPKRFFGPHAKFRVGEQEKMCLCRIACYPRNAISDVAPYCDSVAPFNQVAAEVLVARSTKGRIIQQLDFHGKEDSDKIRPDAVLLHSDKTGAAIEIVKASLSKK